MTPAWWVVATVVVGAAVSGCGAIVEVPVASTSETSGTEGQSDGQSESPSGDERGSETAASSSEGETEAPDVDGASTSGTTGGDGSGDESQSLPFCHVLERVTYTPEDGSWAQAAIDVPADESASVLGVSLRVTHPRISDLQIRLRAPDGALASLLDRPACDEAHLEAVFEDGAEQLGNALCMMDGLAAIRGSVAAIDELAPLLRAPVGGRWLLELTDAVPGEQGTLDQACVVLTVEGP